MHTTSFSSISDSELDSVTVQLGNLDITVTVRHRDQSASASSGAPAASVGAAVRERSADFQEWFEASEDLIEAARAAHLPSELAALDLPGLASQRGRLRGSDSAWVPAARVARAFRAGTFARGRLEGQIFDTTSDSPACPYRNTIYIVLRAGATTDSFWTSSYSAYIQGVKLPNGSFHPESISHAFATQAEAECYLAGARRRWPHQR